MICIVHCVVYFVKRYRQNIMKINSKNLQKVLLELNISQTEMAKILEISRQQLNNVINGRANLTDRNLLILLRQFKVNANYLLDNCGPMFLEPLDNVVVVKLKKGQLLKVEYED